MLTYFNFIPDKECDLFNKQHNVHKKYRGVPKFVTKNNLGGTISLIACHSSIVELLILRYPHRNTFKSLG